MIRKFWIYYTLGDRKSFLPFPPWSFNAIASEKLHRIYSVRKTNERTVICTSIMESDNDIRIFAAHFSELKDYIVFALAVKMKSRRDIFHAKTTRDARLAISKIITYNDAMRRDSARSRLRNIVHWFYISNVRKNLATVSTRIFFLASFLCLSKSRETNLECHSIRTFVNLFFVRNFWRTLNTRVVRVKFSIARRAIETARRSIFRKDCREAAFYFYFFFLNKHRVLLMSVVVC